MSLSHGQRLERLKVRTAELAYWRIREAVAIDNWTFNGEPILRGAPWPHRDGTVHFAATAEIPANWPLDEVRLQMDLGGESLVTLTYSTHSDSFGLDPYHQDFPLKARTFAISTDSVARLPFGEPSRAPRLHRGQLSWLDVPVHRLHMLLVQIAEAVATLGNHEVIPHLLLAAETALRSLDWPSATDTYISRIASSPQQQAIWQLPALTPNPPGLDDEQRRSVTAAHEALTARLRELQVLYPPQGKIALTGHAHIDLAWLWPYAETRRKLRRTFHTALTLMEKSAGFRFNQSTAQYYAQVEEDDPELFRRIEKAVQSGQWETIGGMWVEPDTNMPTGESLTRQILYGQRYFERKFGTRHTICWLPDCFGFSGALPQLLRQGGIDSFFTIKVNWSEQNRIPADLFWWEGLDGSRVLTHTFDNPVQGYNGLVNANSFADTWRNFKSKALHNTSLLAVGYGDGGGGVTPDMIERQEQLGDFPAIPQASWSRVSDFFTTAHETAAARQLPVWSGEIYLELHRATLTTQSGVKRLHRRAERSLITAETVASLDHLLGGPSPESLEPDWRIVLRNEFHDILPGSSIREVYQDAERELSGVVATSMARQQSSLVSLRSRLRKGEIEHALVVVNPSLDTRRLAGFGAEVPPMSVSVLDMMALSTPSDDLAWSHRHLENAHLKATIGEDGTLISLIHKASGREALSEPSRVWVYPIDKPRSWDAWDIDEDYAAVGVALDKPELIALHEQAFTTAAIRVRYRYRDSTVTLTYRLAADSPRLDVETTLDWHDRKTLVRLLVPTSVRARRATFECAYGIVERPTHTNTSWDAAMFEAAAHRFVDISEHGFGVALLNDAKYGHSARGNTLGMSLVRGPVYPDPMADEGEQTFTYALYPHSGGWADGGVRQEADDLNQPLLLASASGLAAGVHTPLAVGGYPVALSGLKAAEDGKGLILRVYEPAGGRGELSIALPSGWSVAGTVSILEEPMESGTAIAPFEVKSWRLVRT